VLTLLIEHFYVHLWYQCHTTYRYNIYKYNTWL